MGKRIDITGMRFNNPIAIRDAGYVNKQGSRMWKCWCECGNFIDVAASELRSTAPRSCGCKNYNKLNLLNQTFGFLTVEKELSKNKHGSRQWLCKCCCGNTTVVSTNALTSNHTQSCGCKKRNQLPSGEGSFNAVYSTYKSTAKKKNRTFNLTKAQFKELTQQPCDYCGCSPSQIRNAKKSNGAYVYNGIDRVDNSIGYIYENCVPCCKACNLAKRELSKDEFLRLIEKIYTHSVSKELQYG